MLKIDLAPEIGQLRREFANVSPKVFAMALSRALNHVGAKARTESSRDIRKVYKIPAKNIKEDIKLIRATTKKLSAQLHSRGNPLPVVAFSPSQTRKGVTIRVGNTRKLLRSAFIVNLKNGHKGVFAKGRYDGKFKWRSLRDKKGGNDTAINELMTKSVPRALSERSVIASMKARVGSDLPQRVRHEIRYELSQRIGRR